MVRLAPPSPHGSTGLINTAQVEDWGVGHQYGEEDQYAAENLVAACVKSTEGVVELVEMDHEWYQQFAEFGYEHSTCHSEGLRASCTRGLAERIWVHNAQTMFRFVVRPEGGAVGGYLRSVQRLVLGCHDMPRQRLLCVDDQEFAGLNIRITIIIDTSHFYFGLVLGCIYADLCK